MGLLQYSAIPLILFAVFCQRIYVKHWYTSRELTLDDFPAGNYTLEHVPITYYEAGKIDKVLSDWFTGFMLYRAKDFENFKFNPEDIDSKVHAKVVLPDDKCPWKSALCTPCYNFDEHMVETNVSTLLRTTGHYASFAEVEPQTAKKIWDAFGFPMPFNSHNMEHAFFGNFDKGRLTASLHANPLTNSVGIHVIGHKLWLFFDTKTYTDGFYGTPSTPLMLPRKAPTEPYKVYWMVSRPGDVVFFPEAYAHIVYTFEGPSAMINYRKLTIQNFIRQPFMFASVFANRLLFTWPWQMSDDKSYTLDMEKSGGKRQARKAIHTTKLHEFAIKRVEDVCRNHGISEWDKQMMGTIEELVQKARDEGMVPGTVAKN